MARNTDIRGRLKKELSDDISRIDEKLDRQPPPTTYPIYILDLGDAEPLIVVSPGKKDIDHSDFWAKTVSKIVAKRLKLPVRPLKNLPYCQRRARICGKVVLYGERTSRKLLRLIEKAVGETGMRFLYDDHEKRLPYDVADFRMVIGFAKDVTCPSPR